MNFRRPVIFTFDPCEWYDKPLVVINVGERPSFVDVGLNRISLGVGEEKSFDIPRGAGYRIGFGVGVRLLETGQELVKR